MAGWGRNAYPEMAMAQRPSRLGLWSLICALIAFGLVAVALAAMLSLPTDASETASNAATIALAIAFFLVAPILHVVGAILGIVGLSRGGESRTRCIIGIVLNVALVALGGFFAWAAIGQIGAFT